MLLCCAHKAYLCISSMLCALLHSNVSSLFFRNEQGCSGHVHVW